MVLFLVIFVVIGLTFKTSAADVNVNAFVNGPPPAGPATILSPLDGETFTAAPVTFSGTCPVGGGNMVKLYRNGIFTGATLCTLAGTFQIQSDLFEGLNVMESKVFNGIDVEGPTAPTINVYYNPPPPPAEPDAQTPTTTSKPVSQAPTTQLLLKTENAFKGYFTGDTINWELEIIGGRSPYALTVNWGDGGLSTLSRKDAGKFKIKHTYESPGVNQDSYTIKIALTDDAGGSTFLQMMVIVRDKQEITAAIPGSTTASIPPLNLSLQYKVALPIYLGLLMLVGTFWLGERQELHKLKPLVMSGNSRRRKI